MPLSESLELISKNKMFDGWNERYQHSSSALNCSMRFTVYMPPQASQTNRVPVLYWLSGLTCTDENFIQKSGVQETAAELGIALVVPDTSPRGSDVVDDPESAYDLGHGAGFYLNASVKPWSDHYKMYDYILSELPELIEANFHVNAKKSISGHSMGGHGALVLSLRNPAAYLSASAFSPISNPMNAPWGIKAFSTYLGDDTESWKQYDACHLIASASTFVPTRVDQGLADNFISEQLMPNALIAAAKEANFPLIYKDHDDYDHSYFFIASFIQEHLRFHAQYLS